MIKKTIYATLASIKNINGDTIMEKLLFTADLHGNIEQYKSTLHHAADHNIDIVVFGGDLTPKDPERRTPEKQRAFLEQELFPLLEEFRKDHNTHVLFIMGNDDFKSNHDIMVNGQDFYGYRIIDQIPYISQSGYVFVGYTPVPFTPFQYKCWEKRDLEAHTDFSHRDDTRIQGVVSHGDELTPYSLSEAFAQSSIEDDLNQLTQGLDMNKLILISHAPPFETVCDYNREHKHVGSQAVKQFIQTKQPYMSLHGHIHETVDLKGEYQEAIGRTISVAVGNDHRPQTPFVIEAELNASPNVRRLKL